MKMSDDKIRFCVCGESMPKLTQIFSIQLYTLSEKTFILWSRTSYPLLP